MTIHFMCCCGAKTYYLPDKMAGSKVRCPTCRAIMVTPQPTNSGQVVIAAPAEEEHGDQQWSEGEY